MWLPTSGTRSYKNSLLDNIKKLTFEILTPKGEQIYIFDSDGKVINPTDESNKCLYECVNDNIQVNLALVFGVVENELNTNTKFEY